MIPYHQKFPKGRVGTSQFCELTGLGRTTFLMKYRPDPYYIELFDIRVDALNRLNMSEKAARAFAQMRVGKRPQGKIGRVRGVLCPQCETSVARYAKCCRTCGKSIVADPPVDADHLPAGGEAEIDCSQG